MTSFVIVVDAQGDFMRSDGALPVPGAEPLIAPMQGWLGGLRVEDTAGVLFTFDTHVDDIYAASPESEQFPIHCVRGTSGWASVLDHARIDPAIPLYRLEKGVFDMWVEDGIAIEDIRHPERAATPRERFFAELRGRGVKEMIVIGVAADFCVRWAAAGLLARGFQVTVPPHLTRGIVHQIDTVMTELQAA